MSDTIFLLKRRRSHETAGALLDECLAILESIAERAPAAHVAPPLSRVRRRAPGSDAWPADLVGASPSAVELRKTIAALARDRHVPVLIVGECGTEVEHVARALHIASHRSSFVTLACAGLSSAGLAQHLKRGRGTVLLHGLEELPRDAQDVVIHRLRQSPAAARERPRVIATTPIDLADACRRGALRGELYYRFKPFRLVIPPLRDRSDADVHALIEAILTRLATQRQLPPMTLAADALALLRAHPWPGNVWELEAVIESMCVAAAGADTLAAAHVPRYLSAARGSANDGGSPAAARSLRDATATSASAARGALAKNNYHCGRTASELGISRHQLYRLLKRSGLSDSRVEPRPA